MTTRRLVLLSLLIGACGQKATKQPPPEPPPAPPRTFDQCEAGDQAFVKTAYLGVLGQRPSGQAEINLYVDLLREARKLAKDGASLGDARTPEQWVVRALSQDPRYLDRWADHFMDALKVHRIEVQSQRRCYDRPLRKDHDGSLARLVRDELATAAGDGEPFNMADLLRSSLMLDDVSPIYRGHLFALVNRPIPAANVPRIEAELARRADFGQQFDSTYLHRDIVCLACHTTTNSITSHPSPELNRHWPLPGDVESAIYGRPEGIEPERAHAPFRYDGFVADRFGNATPDTAPWGWDSSCGVFQTAEMEPDVAGVQGFFGELRGDQLTVFDMDRALSLGFTSIAKHGLPTGASLPNANDALAYMVAARITETVWEEVVGSSLTISNYYPRNKESRDILYQLTETFVESGFSLRTLLAEILTSPYVNRLAPEDGCGAGPYNMPPIYDPWVTSDGEEERRNNSMADGIAALSPRTLLRTAYEALEWNRPYFMSFPESGSVGFCVQSFSCAELEEQCLQEQNCCVAYDFKCLNPPAEGQPRSGESRSFQRGVGVFLKGGEPGFRGLDFQARLVFEDRFGACRNPDDRPDFVAALADRAVARGATLNDAVVTLKDRLVNVPEVSDSETKLLEKLFQAPLSTPAEDVDDLDLNLRALCGVLTSSPQFLLSGMSSKDGAEVPALTPPHATYNALCRSLATLGDKLGAVIDCGLGAARLSPL